MDFHDGLVELVEVSPSSGEIEVIVSAYPDEQATRRSKFRISFLGVSFFSFVADFDEMKRNEFAGTVVSVREEEDMTTNIYLTGGILVIRSRGRTVRLE